MKYGDPKASPVQGDVIELGVLKIRVGYSNGDFRSIVIKDWLDRPLATGSVPWKALREIKEKYRDE